MRGKKSKGKKTAEKNAVNEPEKSITIEPKQETITEEIIEEKKPKLKAVLFGPDTDNPHRPRLLVDLTENIAHYMDAFSDSLVVDGTVPVERVEDPDFQKWCNGQGYAVSTICMLKEEIQKKLLE